jgi:hypothetical protein
VANRLCQKGAVEEADLVGEKIRITPTITRMRPLPLNIPIKAGAAAVVTKSLFFL